jgi:peroxiredoxin (alkyl hydroperoxide reductase subunit C)
MSSVCQRKGRQYQSEMAERFHLPFAVLSDEKLSLTCALGLPTMEVAGLILIRRLTLIIDDGRIRHVFYPVFPPDRNAADVLSWLKTNPFHDNGPSPAIE